MPIVFTEYYFLFVFFIGILIGSFLNVVILRLPKEQSIVHPRSACPSCKKQLKAWHNIPVLSYLFLLGKCSFCKKKISIRYPLVELLTAVLLTAVFFLDKGSLFEFWIRDVPFVCGLIVIAFIDFDHQIIPDELSLGGLAYGLLTSFLSTNLTVIQCIMGAALGFFLFYGLSFLYYKFSGKIGLGGGDIKYLAMAGAFIGIEGVFYTLLISSMTGAVIGILYGLLRKEKNLMGMALPYGPFLVLGTFIYLFAGDFLWLQFMTLI